MIALCVLYLLAKKKKIQKPKQKNKNKNNTIKLGKIGLSSPNPNKLESSQQTLND